MGTLHALDALHQLFGYLRSKKNQTCAPATGSCAAALVSQRLQTVSNVLNLLPSVDSDFRVKALLFHMVKQLENADAKRVRNDFDGIERRIGIPCFNPTQVGLIKPALLSKDNLAHTSRNAQGAHA